MAVEGDSRAIISSSNPKLAPIVGRNSHRHLT